MEHVRVTDPSEIDAVRREEINGDIYDDGECWADPVSLLIYRQNQLKE